MAAHCELRAADCRLQTADFRLLTIYFLLLTTDYLPTTYYLVLTTYYLLLLCARVRSGSCTASFPASSLMFRGRGRWRRASTRCECTIPHYSVTFHQREVLDHTPTAQTNNTTPHQSHKCTTPTHRNAPQRTTTHHYAPLRTTPHHYAPHRTVAHHSTARPQPQYHNHPIATSCPHTNTADPPSNRL
jgi:hypothetical protein